MPEDKLNKIDNSENTGGDVKVDNFSKTKEFLTQAGIDESLIQQVLNDEDSKKDKIYEKFTDFLDKASNVQKIRCKKELKNCKTLDDIKSVILENIGYKVGIVEFSEEIGLIKEQKQETVTQQQETVTQQQKTVAQQQETVTQQQETVTQQQEMGNQIEKMKKAIEARDLLVKKYESKDLTRDLDTLTNENSKNFQETKTKLESNGVINQLKNQLNDQIKEDNEDKNKKNETINKFINDYILLQTTLTELKSNPTIYDQNDVSYFDKIVKNLDNACNIPDTNLNSFSSKNITRTRHELFNSDIGNQDLINLKESNIKDKNSKMGTENSEYDEMFPEMSEKDLVQTYGKFLHKAAKPYLDRYNQHLANGTIDQYRQTNECKQFIQTINNIKLAFDNKTKDLVEELCIISQIKGMYMCMGEGAKFDLNKSREIKSENGILTLNGHIDGIAFSIRQDTNNPNARLQTLTKLDKQDNAFVIGDNFVDSNFILPSQSEVFNLAVKSVNSDGALQEAESPADYVSKLQDKIMSKMDNMYEDTKYANHYMHEQVKGEQVMDKSLSLVKNIKKSEIPTPITESNKGLFDFIGLLHFNIQNSTSLEKDRMNSCLEKIQNLVNEYQDTDKVPESGKYPPIIEHYLTDKAILKNTKTLLEGGVVEGESMFDLFGKYRDKSDQRSDGKFGMIDLASLENDLIPRKEGRSLIAENYAEINTQKEGGYADVYLNNQLKGISETPAFA